MRTRTRHQGRTVSKGFTLVELLVVITIIGVLLGTLLPTLAKIRVLMLVNASQTMINQIDVAVRQYYDEHDGRYPPDGAVLATCVAVAHPKDPNNTRMGSYGPYNGTDKMAWRTAMVGGETDPDNGTGPRMFHDAFGNPILYFRFDRTANAFVAGALRSDIHNGIPSNLGGYLSGEGGAYYRQDFVLITPGPNSQWEAHYSGGWTTSDDQNNYLTTE